MSMNNEEQEKSLVKYESIRIDLSRPYSKGYKAGQLNLFGRERCPFEPSDVSAWLWLKGYEKGKADGRTRTEAFDTEALLDDSDAAWDGC